MSLTTNQPSTSASRSLFWTTPASDPDISLTQVAFLLFETRDVAMHSLIDASGTIVSYCPDAAHGDKNICAQNFSYILSIW